MKTVRLTEILLYYDGIEIFAASDPIGGHYVGDMIDTLGNHDRYAVVGVSPERLADFRTGRVDLRTLLQEAPGGEWHIAIPEGDIDDPQALMPQSAPLTESGFLPKSGLCLMPDDPPDGRAVEQTLERGQAVTLTGLVEQANRGSGEWALLTEDGIQSGKT